VVLSPERFLGASTLVEALLQNQSGNDDSIKTDKRKNTPEVILKSNMFILGKIQIMFTKNSFSDFIT
jgi:hypothetical protein